MSAFSLACPVRACYKRPVAGNTGSRVWRPDSHGGYTAIIRRFFCARVARCIPDMPAASLQLGVVMWEGATPAGSMRPVRQPA